MFRRIAFLMLGLVSTPGIAESRDPTQPAYLLPSSAAAAFHGGYTTSDSGNIELVLSAIIISSHSKRATINGISAKQGQTIEINQAPALKPKSETLASAGKKTLGNANADADALPETHENIAPHPKTATIPTHSNTVKIIKITKNSVTVDQNGELKTLQLVQRPYQNTLK